MTLYDEIQEKITGRLAIQRPEADALEWILKGQAGLHVEIGTLWGGTAVLAALTKGKGKVITIDYMREGFWDTGDTEIPGHPCPSYGIVMQNLAKFGVEKRVEVVKAMSHPWPLDAKLRPVSVLIDGEHQYAGCLQDWQNVKKLAKQYIFFHDYASSAHPGVQRVVDEVARKDPDWILHGVYGTLAVFEKA